MPVFPIHLQGRRRISGPFPIVTKYFCDRGHGAGQSQKFRGAAAATVCALVRMCMILRSHRDIPCAHFSAWRNPNIFSKIADAFCISKNGISRIASQCSRR